MLHQNNDRDRIEDGCLALHIGAGVCFAQPDQTLEHAYRLPILAYSRVLPQELVVGVKDDFCLFADDRLEHFLYECNVLAQFGRGPLLTLT